MQTVGPTTWGTAWQHPVEWNMCLLKKCGRLIAKRGPNSTPHLLPPYSFNVTCHPSCLEVDFIPHPLDLGWPCGLFWSIEWSKSDHEPVLSPDLRRPCTTSPHSLRPLPPPGEQAQANLIEEERPYGAETGCPS